MERDRISYSDHYGCILTFKNMLKKKNKTDTKSNVIWNTKKIGGWEIYKSVTSKSELFKCDESVENNDPEMLMAKISKDLEKCKYLAFGKIKRKVKSNTHSKVEDLMRERDKCMENEHEDEERKVAKLNRE